MRYIKAQIWESRCLPIKKRVFLNCSKNWILREKNDKKRKKDLFNFTVPYYTSQPTQLRIRLINQYWNISLILLSSPKSKFETNRSRGSFVMIGHKNNQTNRDQYLFVNWNISRETENFVIGGNSQLLYGEVK